MTRTFPRSFRRAAAALLCACAPVLAQDSASLASKHIAQVHAVQNRVFAFSEDGTAYSQLDLFADPPQVLTRTWPWEGGAEGGAPWSESLLLRANYWISDSQSVARVTSLRYAGTFRGGDSLIFRDPLSDTASNVASGRLTALAVRDSAGTYDAVLGFGRLGIATARLAPESGPASATLFDAADSLVNVLAFPRGSATAVPFATCRWNRVCRVDTIPAGAPRDSVTWIAVDSSHADSTWLLVATDRGLRRGLWGGTEFPYVTLPGTDSAGETVRSVWTHPARAVAWAFTGGGMFYSDDHGASFRAPVPPGPGVLDPGTLGGFSTARAPQAAFTGDTTFVNVGLDRPGLLAFRRDTVLAGSGVGIDAILIDTADGLDISRDEQQLTALAVARLPGAPAAVLVVGSEAKGVFHRRLDDPSASFENLNLLRVVRGGLTEVITYPTLLTEGRACNEQYVRIGYRLKSDARVTITVYNPAMERVRVLVRNAARRGGIARSESIAEDRWDGCDARGRMVSVGTYYILVESDKGEKGFGKAIVTRGRR